ncbi:hypothetical protein P5E51_15550, partial [Clostridium perfringens]|nr:hypothetical protein [Clostridium perfringens]
GTMRKQYRAYTEDTYHGEAPTLDSPEGKALLAQNPDLIESKVLQEEIPEILEAVKSDTSKTDLNAKKDK